MTAFVFTAYLHALRSFGSIAAKHLLQLVRISGSVYKVDSCRNITGYIGVGGDLDSSLTDARTTRKVLNSMFLVQEYIDGGNLRMQLLLQVGCTHSL
jgi:serine/threonine protein kinase